MLEINNQGNQKAHYHSVRHFNFLKVKIVFLISLNSEAEGVEKARHAEKKYKIGDRLVVVQYA